MQTPPPAVPGNGRIRTSPPQQRNSVLRAPLRRLGFSISPLPSGGVTPFVVPLCAASSLECVSSCRATSWKGGGRPYECSVLSCAWNAPRALTGALASTAQCSSCGHAEAGGGWRRRGRSRRSNNLVRRCCSLAVSVIWSHSVDMDFVFCLLRANLVEVVVSYSIDSPFYDSSSKHVLSDFKLSPLASKLCRIRI